MVRKCFLVFDWMPKDLFLKDKWMTKKYYTEWSVTEKHTQRQQTKTKEDDDEKKTWIEIHMRFVLLKFRNLSGNSYKI